MVMVMSELQQSHTNLSWDMAKLDATSHELTTDNNVTGNEDVAYGNLPYPDFTQIGAVRISFIIVYVIVMILALSGNAMVCYTVFRNKKMHTAVNYYIVNLGISDFMVGFLVMPVKLLEMTAPAEWGMLNDTLCTVLLYVPTIVVFASVLTLVATCFERYYAVVHPLQSRMLHSKSRVLYILAGVWVIPSVAAVPFLKPAYAITHELSSTYGTIRRQACMQSLDDNLRRYYYTFLFFVFYFGPLLIITGTCIRIACCLLTGIKLQRVGTLRRQEINRRKIAKMVIVVALAFAICWTPYFTISMVTQYHPVNYFEHQNYYFTMLCINLFAFTNSCVNPFIYASMSVRFRNGFKSILRPVVCGNEVNQQLFNAHNIGIDKDKLDRNGQQQIHQRRLIRDRYMNTKTRPKRLIKGPMDKGQRGSVTTPTSPSSYSDIQLTLLRLGSLRTFSGVNTKLLGGDKNFNFRNLVIPASPPLETTVTRTSRLASVSTSRRSSYNASSRLALNTPTNTTLEDILTCPTYKHWVREMERTEFVNKTATCTLPIPRDTTVGGRERASSFSCGITANDNEIERRKARVQFGNVIEHSHSAVELSSRKDASDGVSQDDAIVGNGQARHRTGPHYCLDLAISFDRKLSSSSLTDAWCRRFSNAALPIDGGETSKVGTSNGTTVQQHLTVPGTEPEDKPPGRRRSSVLSNRELSTCDEEPDLPIVDHVKRSTSDTILSLFPAVNGETFL